MKRALVVLCRHGNTFNAGEPAFMVGAREDLALTEHGRAQGIALGRELRLAGVVIDRVYSGPLKRTREFAEVIINELGRDNFTESGYRIDARLLELDYGLWSGLTRDEILALHYGAEGLERWEGVGEYPQGVGFSPSREQVAHELLGLLNELNTLGGVSLIVTSNGRLRVLGGLVTGDLTKSWKVGTGRVCVLEGRDAGLTAGGWGVLGWDEGLQGIKKFF